MESTSQNRGEILVADDDPALRRLIRRRLETAGYRVHTASDGDEALTRLSGRIQAALIDLRMPGKDGLECLRFIENKFPSIESIVITSSAEVEDAVLAMKSGAFDYLTKPLNIDVLLERVDRATSTYRLKEENQQLRAAMETLRVRNPFIGDSPAAQEVLEAVSKIAGLDSSVLITGESGVGKGLVARLLHGSGPRRHRPFITVSCTSLPRDLVEAELFGHEKGAFTGAIDRRPGRLEMADGGTLFLDEIGDMPLELQPKLLHFLQDHSFQRIRGARTITVDVRVVAATHHDLREMCKEQRFREDLFFRLNVLPIHIAPVRQRRDDIPLIVDHILNKLIRRRGTKGFRIVPDALKNLVEYDWPGNVREIENVLERITAFCNDNIIRQRDLPPEILSRDPGPPLDLGGIPLRQLEKSAVEQTLRLCRGNKSETARRLGISEKSVYNKIKRLGIEEIGGRPSESESPDFG